MHMPTRRPSPPRSSAEWAVHRAEAVTASATYPMTRRRSGAAFQAMAPQAMPEIMFPAAKTPYRMPFSPGSPIDSVYAARDTCIPPKTDPMPRKMTIRTRTPGTRSAETCSTRAFPRAATSGCVPFCAANSRPPTRVSAASVIRPAAGSTTVHRAVASSGPTTKVSSSVTDSKAAAVVISGEFLSFTPQRARTMGPTWGTEAPVGTAAANNAHSGAPFSASVVRVSPDRVWSRTPGTRTARCP
ncbi:hypothetical protein SHIRM173S_11789 [Streptomyces hirsutus]